jgi:hypothetical protein
MKLRNLYILLWVITLQSCSKNEFENDKYNAATTWSSDFNYTKLSENIEGQYQDGSYDKLLPVGDKWTYGTLQPDGSQIDLIDNDYIKCYTLDKTGITSKAQLVRKFPPYGILDNYEGVTAFNPGDLLLVTMDLFINSNYLNDKKVYFLDFEDSMKKVQVSVFLCITTQLLE